MKMLHHEKTYELKKLTKAMKKVQDAKRFQHTLGVSFTAASLAMCHGEDIEKAQVAGLLHDCAKCFSDEKNLSICEKHHIPVTDVERRNPFLLHAKVGGFLAMEEYHIDDQDIINAIIFHTTGRPDMSRLEKIVFIADYIEPGRNKAKNLSEIRKMAFRDLDSTCKMILEDTLEYLKQGEGETDPMTEQTYKYYCEEINNESEID